MLPLKKITIKTHWTLTALQDLTTSWSHLSQFAEMMTNVDQRLIQTDFGSAEGQQGRTRTRTSFREKESEALILSRISRMKETFRFLVVLVPLLVSVKRSGKSKYKRIQPDFQLRMAKRQNSWRNLWGSIPFQNSVQNFLL